MADQQEEKQNTPEYAVRQCPGKPKTALRKFASLSLELILLIFAKRLIFSGS